jgi:RNA polymerase sigma factor (sigma-70 family)
VVRKFESLASESATLHAYLREIAGFPSLTPDDERHLGRQIQQYGDEDALGRLVQSNLRFVVVYAKRFRRLGVPLLDLIHEGNLGLIEAARRFDPSRGSNFQSSALWWIRQAVMHLLADAARTPALSTAGLMASAVAGRQVDAIRIALEQAQASAATEHPAPATDDDLLASLREETGGRRRRKTRKALTGRHLESGALQALRQPSVLRGYLN